MAMLGGIGGTAGQGVHILCIEDMDTLMAGSGIMVGQWLGVATVTATVTATDILMPMDLS
ncbi:hypothetical protein COY65_02190 [Candidatus Jorgensenbacteria bacterium CG_4_10_14_0_8_um_filter_39_13]|uniref:Uncharacterized protein n=2 Tax=Candidatus Joergenseniibacteriota TaxID=1752739 RepID=A0A2M7RH33_9BACT|nr:MAG: hypothetical protein COV54_03095 [Candidatus Jorgensenbacteria bacterium CG11_big_fil_rev_8_21_14_0_20_38_23]PIV13040.1 MAG: hypothetical protein COS46_02440 [Candidatus Jorgensenbacteria bacterium CG03_land_8_20_14_0_80_38_39]PIW97517.1 MAG: hypothetical protein COZ81_02050 [Candidatus Jorgensenbacteria bacterium CG_4_8_14_3_um_filter_38_10]PIY95867.1 MAG: hypothetical protein COY65_02190 [Candidatus Jorgensenbacteria bacterium CG_4_10_14_0_8_um_filter_39_13]PJA94723.1 MAG: hypothetica